MHPVLFYLLSVLGLTLTSTVGLMLVNKAYSRQNMYPEVAKPENDLKNYKIFTLPNQMHVMIIDTNQTEFSALAIKADIGYMSDPPEFQGMNNYIQNLLITSQKYPSEDFLNKFLLMNAGKDKRTQTDVESIYYVEIKNQAFFQLLDIYSKFFIEPQFTKQFMDKTAQYLHSYWKNKGNNLYLQQLAAKPNHPFSHFYDGNLQTLYEIPEQHDKNPYIEVIKFFRAKYSANRLSLVIYTHEDMKQRVTELLFEYFNVVVNKQLSKPSFRQYAQPFLIQRFFYIQNSGREVRLLFDFDAETNYLTKSIQFVVFLLMESFENNFCYEQLYIQQTCYRCSYTLKESQTEFAILEITMQLHKDVKMAPILRSLYSRINYIKKQTSFETQWGTIQKISQIRRDYQDFDISDITHIASNLKNHFNKDIFSFEVFTQYDLPSIKAAIEYLNPVNMNILYLDNFYDNLFELQLPKLEFKSFMQQLYNLTYNPAPFQQDQEENKEKKDEQEEDPEKKKIMRKIYTGKVKRKVRKIKEHAENELHYYDDPIHDIEEVSSEGEDESVKQEEPDEEKEPDELDEIQDVPLYTDFDYDISKGQNTPSIESFKYHNFFDKFYFEAGMSADTITQLNNEKSEQKFKDDWAIPKNFEVLPNPIQLEEANQRQRKKSTFKYPELLETSSAGNLWHVLDVTNNLPKVSFRLLVRYLDYKNDGLSYMALTLLNSNFKHLTKYTMFSKVTIHYGAGWLEFKLDCYSDQVDEIVKLLIQEHTAAYTIENQKQYEMLVDKCKHEQLVNEYIVSPIEQGKLYLKELLASSQEYQKHQFDIKFEQVTAKLKQLLAAQRWDVLLYGNIEADHAKSLYKQIQQKSSSSSKGLVIDEILKLTKHPITFREAKLSGQSIVTLNLYQGSERNLAQYTYMLLFEKLMQIQIEDYLFHQLQLGFVVSVQMIDILNIDSLAIIVQSNTYDPEEIDFYIEESLGHFEGYLSKLSDKDYMTIKESISKSILQIPFTIDKQADLIWSEIKNGQYYFTLRECTNIALDKIAKSDLMKFFQLHFKARNSKISLQLYRNKSFIPQGVLREQDTFAHKVSQLVLSQEELKAALKDSYKLKSKYIVEAPHYAC